jgi:hypothetical protein
MLDLPPERPEDVSLCPSKNALVRELKNPATTFTLNMRGASSFRRSVMPFAFDTSGTGN